MAGAISRQASKKAATQAALSESLAAKAAAGDEAAFGEIFDLLAPRLLRLISQIVAARETAEEILNGVFVDLSKVLGTLSRGKASVAAWLAHEARTQAVKVRRSESRNSHGGAPRTDAILLPIALLPPPEETNRVDARHALLAKVLRHLPKRQIQVLEMAVYEGLTEAEIASKLNQPLGVVSAELRAAIRFLRHRLRAVLGTWTADI
jgi:RNA polymerase sigma-70 factor, ECF subfamily